MEAICKVTRDRVEMRLVGPGGECVFGHDRTDRGWRGDGKVKDWQNELVRIGWAEDEEVAGELLWEQLSGSELMDIADHIQTWKDDNQ